MNKVRAYGALVLAVFAVSRVLYALAGVRFSLAGLWCSEQFLDPLLLRERLGESLLYLHCQPPLFNLILGAVFKLFPGREIAAFTLLYLALGLSLGLSLYALLVRMSVGPGLSAFLASVFIASPGCVLFENYLFYSYFIAAFLCLSALFLHRYLSRGRFIDGAAFFAFLAALVLIRNVFHLAWFLAAAALVLLAPGLSRRKTLLAASVPALLVAGLYLKNFLLFGLPSASSSLGMSLYHMAAGHLPAAARADIVRSSKGAISDLALLPPVPTLKSLWAYPASWTDLPPTGIPVLDLKMKSNGADPNFNHLAYLFIGRQYAADALRLIRARPDCYLESVRFACRCYFLPADDYFHDEWRLPLPRVSRVYDLLFHGRFAPFRPVLAQYEFSRRYEDRRTALALLIGIPLVSLFGAAEAVRAIRRRPFARAYALTLLFLLGAIAWASAVANLFSMGENMRHRFALDPFFLVLLGILLTRAFPAVRRALSRRSGGA